MSPAGPAFRAALAAPPPLAGFFDWQGRDRHWTAYFYGEVDEAQRLCAASGAQIVQLKTPSLNEIFVAMVGSKHSRQETSA